MNYCGIDVGHKSLDMVIRKNGKSLKNITLNNSSTGHEAILKLLKKHKVTRVGLEKKGVKALFC